MRLRERITTATIIEFFICLMLIAWIVQHVSKSVGLMFVLLFVRDLIQRATIVQLDLDLQDLEERLEDSGSRHHSVTYPKGDH